MSETNSSEVASRLFTKSDLEQEQHSILDQLLKVEGGMILIDKEYGVSSFTVVYLLRKLLTKISGDKWIKVGHAGTLDPLASGLMILGTRRSTRSLTQFLASSKEYQVEMRLGITTPSYDLEKTITVTHDLIGITPEAVKESILSFQGKQLQTPPIFSAIKQGGKAVYHRARKGKEVVIEPKEIEIYSIHDITIQLPYATFTVCCSKGTYIRSLIHEIGNMLGTGATLTDLRRSKVGGYCIEDALTPTMLKSLSHSVQFAAWL